MKILIVDDHEASVTFMRLAFAGVGHTVATAPNVDAALRRADDDTPDVVLTDLTFGEAGGGFDLARALRASPATGDVGILAVSGADTPDVMQATNDCGFDGFVSKPVDLASLLDRVEQLADVVARRRDQHQVDRP